MRTEARSLESLLSSFRDPHRRGRLTFNDLERLLTNGVNLGLTADEWSIAQSHQRGLIRQSQVPSLVTE